MMEQRVFLDSSQPDIASNSQYSIYLFIQSCMYSYDDLVHVFLCMCMMSYSYEMIKHFMYMLLS